MRPQLPDYGCFPRWPENGHDFIHPEDLKIVSRRIPSERVFRRDSFDGTYYLYRYGSTQFRMKPCMWLKVQPDGIDVGDTVETIGVAMERDLFVAEVYGMYYVRRKGCILYRLRRGEIVVPNLFTANSMKLLTDKSHVRPSEIPHPTPKALDRGERIKGFGM
ncbi:hypothetical protein CA13_32260 [Planctomycetes bacterium CA13]|uniref:Uncharacterized protein n=1 Tax=Novipirellula herctigrandis TaxID=2527986 RepID=A0A5C5Z5C8_9BACT|nr:hypothetical protein CA13_32260 [Planctomycetes bacterium CA13]